MKDFHTVNAETCSKKKWYELIDALNGGNRVHIHPSVFAHFLEALPPVLMFSNGFVFKEGFESPKVFFKVGKKCYGERPISKKKYKELIKR